MSTLILPIHSNSPNYEFQVDLDGTIYTLEFYYNTRAAQWNMSILDSTGEILLIGDIPVLINTPLHDQYIQENLPPGRFIALDETGNNNEAGRNNFGTDIKLFYAEAN